ncbi:Dyp-type peroxidase [Aurantivibrio infirmus]
MPLKPDLDLKDLQGIIRFAHGKMTAARFLLLNIKDRSLAKQWLETAPITTAETVSPIPESALHIAFTASGLTTLGLNPEIIENFSEEFVSGMTAKNRARRLGDTGTNDPAHWYWGSAEHNTPHILLLLYTTPEHLESWHSEITGDNFNQAFNLLNSLDSNNIVDAEPFGFADGISQPAIDWQQEQSTDSHNRDTYSNLLALGEVVLGYPNEYGEFTARPLIPAETRHANLLPDAADQIGLKDLGRNGSYLVFRQLEQDVHGFWRFIEKSAEGDLFEADQLAAAMVGRNRDGSPLVDLSPQHIPGTHENTREKNNFNYDEDPKGIACPIASHVRRSNPRTGDFPPDTSTFLQRILRILGLRGKHNHDDLVASTRFHRILRRGRQYGSTISLEEARQIPTDSNQGERGLHFICLSGSIARQFEFVQNAWIANSTFNALQNEGDPLLGNREALAGGTPTDNFSRQQASGPRQCLKGMPQFVTVRGGAYFFLPGLSALKFIIANSNDNNSI